MFFVQARYLSSRLPGKVLLPFGESSILGFLIKNLRSLFQNIPVVIVTGGKGGDLIKYYSESYGVECFSGPEQNVLERFRLAVEKYQPEFFVRLTADNPLINLMFLKSGLDTFGTLRDQSLSTRIVRIDGGEIYYHGVPKGHNFDIICHDDYDRLFSGDSFLCRESREHVVSNFLLRNSYLSFRDERNIFNLSECSIDTFADYLRAVRSI